MKGILQIVLTEESQDKLKKFAIYESIHCHHVTVMFGISDTDPFVTGIVGKKISMETCTMFDNGDINAITVTVPEEFSWANRIPHVTLSARVGVKPMMSNNIITDDSLAIRTPRFMIDGIVTFTNF